MGFPPCASRAGAGGLFGGPPASTSLASPLSQRGCWGRGFFQTLPPVTVQSELKTFSGFGGGNDDARNMESAAIAKIAAEIPGVSSCARGGLFAHALGASTGEMKSCGEVGLND